MPSLKEYFPSECVESAFSIDYRKLYDLGYRGVIFDIDQTLVPHGDPATPQVEALFDELHAIGLKTVVLSNNSEERIQSFLHGIDCPYAFDVDKPNPAGYLQALDILGVPREQAVYVGDQVFTDVLGANRCGIASILVKYIGHDQPGWKGKRRAAEQVVLFLRKLSPKSRHGIGAIEKQ